MSSWTVCDICGEVVVYRPFRVGVAPEVCVHKEEPVAGSKEVDVCESCIRVVPALRTSLSLAELKALKKREGSR